VKAYNYLKANEMVVQATDDITEMVLMAFATITQEDCLGWIEHSGYSNTVMYVEIYIYHCTVSHSCVSKHDDRLFHLSQGYTFSPLGIPLELEFHHPSVFECL